MRLSAKQNDLGTQPGQSTSVKLSLRQSLSAKGARQSGTQPASWNHPSTRAGDQDDVSYKQTPSNQTIPMFVIWCLFVFNVFFTFSDVLLFLFICFWVSWRRTLFLPSKKTIQELFNLSQRQSNSVHGSHRCLTKWCSARVLEPPFYTRRGPRWREFTSKLFQITSFSMCFDILSDLHGGWPHYQNLQKRLWRIEFARSNKYPDEGFSSTYMVL